MESAVRVCIRCQQRMGLIPRRSLSMQHQGALLQRNYYQVLGVKKNATPIEIKAAYIDLSKKLHPDSNPSPKLEEQNRDQHNSFVELNQAYAILGKSLSRREYDFRLCNPNAHTAGVRVRRATADDPYGTQQNEYDWYADMGAFYRGSNQSDSEFSYYGIKGIQRVSSHYIVYGCIVFIIVGAVVHYFIFRQSRNYVSSRLDEKDRRIAAVYNEAKARALQNGNKKQIELLRARQLEFSMKQKGD